LQIFYNLAYRKRELSYTVIKDLYERLMADKPHLHPFKVWDAYAEIEDQQGEGKLVKRLPRSNSPKKELMALVAAVRKALHIDEYLTAYETVVDRNFQEWVFRKQAGATKFTEEQMQWLRMIKDYVTNSYHIDKEDFDYNPFNAQGGLGKMWQLFGEQTDEIIEELNEALAA
jgi:type I restriction enzyme R subunit